MRSFPLPCLPSTFGQPLLSQAVFGVRASKLPESEAPCASGNLLQRCDGSRLAPVVGQRRGGSRFAANRDQGPWPRETPNGPHAKCRAPRHVAGLWGSEGWKW